MKSIVKAVAITTILGVVTRILGLVIKIYISRNIGAESLGIYQISISIFFLMCTLVSSGIPLVISRQIAKDSTTAPTLVSTGLILSTFISVLICVFVVLFPEIFTKIWGQSESVAVLYSLLPALIFTAVYVPFRGSFWGNKNFFLLGFTELIEQIFRFFTLIVLFNIPRIASGEVITAFSYSVACCLSSILAIAIYFFKGNKIKFSKKLILPMLSQSTPIAIMRIGSSLVSLLISVLLPLKLTEFGLSQTEAISQFGVVSGMVVPIITIPSTLIGSISVAITPEIANSKSKYAQNQINRSISYTIIISTLLLPIFFTLGDQIGLFLYNDNLSGNLIKVGSVIMIPTGVSQITSSILNAIGKEKIGLFSYIVGALLMFGSIIVLPKFVGIYALVIGFFLMSVSTTLINLFVLKPLLNLKPLKDLFLSLIFCFPSGLIAYYSFNLLSSIFPLFVALFVSCSLSCLFMVILYHLFNLINLKDFLPKKLKYAV